MNGLIVIDKPAGCTSHDVVKQWRRLAGTRRVGHLGTLDPMATGLLALLTGPVTRLAPFYERDYKTYEAEVLFGWVSDTYDTDGQLERGKRAVPQRAAIQEALTHFRGSFEQMPPSVSAKKIGGVPAYKLARKKLPVELKPVPVEIRSLAVRDSATEDTDRLQLEVVCSAGTYVRSLAHDLGQLLGCGAVLSALRRTRAGQLTLTAAKTLEQLSEMANRGTLAAAIVPPGQLLPHLPAETMSEAAEAHIRQGRQFRTSPFVVPPGAPLVRALSRRGDLIAIGRVVMPNLYQPSVVITSE